MCILFYSVFPGMFLVYAMVKINLKITSARQPFLRPLIMFPSKKNVKNIGWFPNFSRISTVYWANHTTFWALLVQLLMERESEREDLSSAFRNQHSLIALLWSSSQFTRTSHMSKGRRIREGWNLIGTVRSCCSQFIPCFVSFFSGETLS